jgi:hypothetical protein
VAFVGVNSNRAELADEVASHSEQHGFTFPVVKDPDNVKADFFGARVTPEVFVYDADWKLRYHGRIDDDQKGDKITSKDTRAALDAVLAGKDVPVAETKAFGCSIKRVAKAQADGGKADAAKVEAPAK